MVKYKNFGSSGHSVGSFSYSTQTSHISTNSTRADKNKGLLSNDRDPSITRHESVEDDCRDEDGSRFDPRVLSNDSTEDDEIKGQESESLYDMISYNGTRDDNSTSVCASYSYSVSVGDTESSAGLSDNPASPRRPKLSYMGYVPMSPNTAAAMAKEMKERSHTHRRSNRNGDKDSDQSTEGQTVETGSTFPSVKIDDTSRSQHLEKNYDDQQERRETVSFATEDFTEGVAESNITEYITVGQQRCLDQQKKDRQFNTRDSVTADYSSRFEEATIGTSIVSSVMPNSCSGHPAMKITNSEPPHRGINPLSPMASSQPAGACPISPLSDGVSAYDTAYEMAPPLLNHPPATMQQQWNPSNHNGYQQPYGYQQQQAVHHPSGTNQHQQLPQGIQSGFFPRNPILARQLQAFQQYHSQQQGQEERQPTSPRSMGSRSPSQTRATLSEEKPIATSDKEMKIQNSKSGFSSKDSSSTDDKPVLICGADGPRLMNNVKFVTPTPKRSIASTSLASNSLISGSQYTGGELSVGCAQHPAGMKCQSYIASLINTCGAIVNHGYHIDNTKKSSKEKRAMFGKVAEKSIAGLATTEQSVQDEGASNLTGFESIGTDLNDAFAVNAKKILHAGSNLMNNLPKDLQNFTQAAVYNNVFDTFQKHASPESEDTEETEQAQQSVDSSKPNGTLSPINAKREHFRKLRRRRNRGFDNEGAAVVLPSDASVTPSVASFQRRYTRNIHTKAHQEKLEARKAEDPPAKGDAEPKDDETHCSWATPKSQEADDESKLESSSKPDPLVRTAAPAQSLEENMCGKKSEEVVISTSSGMSESLEGSDIAEEAIESNSTTDSSTSESEDESEEDEEQLLIDSFDHEEFPYTPLDVIAEESEDDETVVNPESIESTNSTDGSIITVTDAFIEERSTETFETSKGIRTPIKSMIGIVRMMFVVMLAFQCGTIICLWDQIADQIRTMEGGPEIIANVEFFVSNVKVSGESLVTTAKDFINVQPIELSVGEMYSEIESRTAAMMGSANEFLSRLKLERAHSEQEEDDEMVLFNKLVGDAFGDDDIFQNGNEE